MVGTGTVRSGLRKDTIGRYRSSRGERWVAARQSTSEKNSAQLSSWTSEWFVVDRLGTRRPRKRRKETAPSWSTENRNS